MQLEIHTDTFSRMEQETYRIERFFFALNLSTFLKKPPWVSYSLGPPIGGFTLSLSGFVKEGVQPDSVDLGIRIAFCPFPALLILLSFIPFYKYDLTEERFEEIKGIIRKT